MPSAGSTVPNTSVAGTCTTKIRSEVSVRTLTRMLKPRPKNALVSPRVHHGILSESSDFEVLKPVRFMGSLLCGAVRVWGHACRGATGVDDAGMRRFRRSAPADAGLA